jgi:hypothetical protein
MSKFIEKMLSEKALSDRGSLEKALANILAAYQRHPSPQAARAMELIRAEIGKPRLALQAGDARSTAPVKLPSLPLDRAGGF